VHTVNVIRAYGRALLAAMFVKGGFDTLRQPGYRPKAVERAGFPEPEFAVKLNGVAMLAGGVMLALGIAPKLASAALVAAIVPTTYVGHQFWAAETEADRRMQQIHFLKNLGLLGGLLLTLSQD
jgi:putative oxidoreductase